MYTHAIYVVSIAQCHLKISQDFLIPWSTASYSGQETVLNIFDPVSAPVTAVCSHRTTILNAFFFFPIFLSANQTYKKKMQDYMLSANKD